MSVKSSSPSAPSKRYRAVVTVEFEAPDRATAIKKAKEQFSDSPQAKIRVQESLMGWMTLPDAVAS
jgi:hypothetical protein